MMNRLLTLAAVVGISLAGAACQSTDFASDDNNYDNRSADRSTLDNARMNGNISDKTPSAQSALEGPVNNSSTNGQLNNNLPSSSANVDMDTTHTAHPSANNTQSGNGNLSNGTTNSVNPGTGSSASENH